jgi:hypothetical protein
MTMNKSPSLFSRPLGGPRLGALPPRARENSNVYSSEPPDVNQTDELEQVSEMPKMDFRNTPPIYSGESRLIQWLDSDRTGMIARLHLLDSEGADRHPFKGLKCSQNAGHRVKMVFSIPVDNEETRTLYSGEGQLVAWSEDYKNGMRVSLKFDSGPDGAEKHPLSELQGGERTGDNIHLVCWAVNDDESLQHPQEARHTVKRPWSSLSPTTQAQIKITRDDDFQEWCISQAKLLVGENVATNLLKENMVKSLTAKSIIYAFCGIASFSEFKNDTKEGWQARQKWQEALRLFEQWRLTSPSHMAWSKPSD